MLRYRRRPPTPESTHHEAPTTQHPPPAIRRRRSLHALTPRSQKAINRKLASLVWRLAHPVPRPTDSPSTMDPEAIRASYGDMLQEPRCVQHVSLDRVCRPTLRFPPQGPPGRVPLLPRYYQSATTSSRPSRRTSLPSFGGTSVALARVRSSTAECTVEAWSWSPGISIRESPRRQGWISQVPGESQLSVCTCSYRRRQDCSHQTSTVQQRGPWTPRCKGSHERSFDAQ